MLHDANEATVQHGYEKDVEAEKGDRTKLWRAVPSAPGPSQSWVWNAECIRRGARENESCPFPAVRCIGYTMRENSIGFSRCACCSKLFTQHWLSQIKGSLHQTQLEEKPERSLCCFIIFCSPWNSALAAESENINTILNMEKFFFILKIFVSLLFWKVGTCHFAAVQWVL